MDTEEELIAAAEQCLREGGDAQKRQRREGQFSSSSAAEPSSDQKLLTQTLRLLLYRSSEVETLLNIKTLSYGRKRGRRSPKSNENVEISPSTPWAPRLLTAT